MRRPRNLSPRTVLIIGVALALAPVLVLGIGFGLAFLFGDRSVTLSEFLLFELEAWVLWLGAIGVVLLIYNHKRHL